MNPRQAQNELAIIPAPVTYSESAEPNASDCARPLVARPTADSERWLSESALRRGAKSPQAESESLSLWPLPWPPRRPRPRPDPGPAAAAVTEGQVGAQRCLGRSRAGGAGGLVNSESHMRGRDPGPGRGGGGGGG